MVMTIMGSFFYIGSQSYSLGFLLTPVAISFILMNLEFSSFSRNDFFIFIFFICFSSCAIAGYFYLRTDDNARVLKFITLFIVQYLFLKSINNHKRSLFIDQVTFFALVLMSVILVLQFTYVYAGFGLNPYKDDVTTYWLMPTSVYGNPNDLSVVSLVLLNYLLYSYQWKYKNILIILSVLLVLVSASRASLVLALVSIYLNLKFYKLFNFKNVLILFFLLVTSYFLNKKMIEEKFEYAINRITSITEHFNLDRISDTSENSMSLRFNSFKYFFENIFKIELGSFSFKDYNFFFNNSTFFNSLIAENPHNFFIELSLLYGVFGFFSCLFLVIYFYNSLSWCKHKFFVFFSFLIILCVPSSVINFLPIWAVLLNVLIKK